MDGMLREEGREDLDDKRKQSRDQNHVTKLTKGLGVSIGAFSATNNVLGVSQSESSSSISVTFDNTDHPDSIDNIANWTRNSGSCCRDDHERLGTWEETPDKRPGNSHDPPQRDLTPNYYENIGGNFIIQQSGGYGNFWSYYQFSQHEDTYPNAPYKPRNLSIRVGASDTERGFNGYGEIILRSSNHEDIFHFYFPAADKNGGFEIDGGVIEDNRNNGLYQVQISNIDWVRKKYSIEVYRQTESGYEQSPVYSNSEMEFKTSASDLDGIYLHSESSMKVYFDNFNVEPSVEQTPTRTSTTTPSPSPTRTPSPEPTRTITATENPTRTKTPKSYRLKKATYYTPVEINGVEYRVLREIPGTDSSKRAVVTPEYEIVDSTTARQALMMETWMSTDFPLDYGSMISSIRERRTKWMILEDLSRIADISTAVAAAIGLLSLGPAAALGPALEAMTDGVVWAGNELDDPYKEQYSKMSEAAGTSRWAKQTLEGASSLADISSEAIGFVNLATDVHDQVTNMRDIAQVARVTIQTARTSGSVTKGLVAGGALGSAVLPQIFLTLATSKAASAATEPFELNARTAALGGAQATVRLPILRRMVELRNKIREGTLKPPGIIEYKMHEISQYQIGSAAAYGMAHHQDQIDESFLGRGYAALFNSEKISSEALKLARRYDNLAKYSFAEIGAGVNETRRKLDDSINAEEFGTEGVL